MDRIKAVRRVWKAAGLAAAAAVLGSGLLALTASGEAAPSERDVRRALKDLPARVDASPLPNYKGDFVSLGPEGQWRQPAGRVLAGAAVAEGEPAADCSNEAITYYAGKAPAVFQKDKKGLLYGVETHTPVTRVWKMPGYNSCALVVYAILKRAGCRWAKYTANARAIYDMARASGWRPSATQTAGCIVAWNSRWKGVRTRIGDRHRREGKVSFRHIGITTGSWMAVDNTSYRSRPEAFITLRPIRYEPPIFLCPPVKEQTGETQSGKTR